LAFYPSSEEQKKRDFEALDELVPITGYGIPGEDKIDDVVLAINENNESSWNDHANSSDEVVFDEVIVESDDTQGSTKVDFNSKCDET
jgi:hypothetical protein